MKQFFIIASLFLPLFSYGADLNLAQTPYSTLKAAFDAAPRAVTFDEIPWATDAKSYWKGCAEYLKDGTKQPGNILIAKWIKKIPDAGPIFDKPETKVNLLYSRGDFPNFSSNDNILSVNPKWYVSADGKSLVIWDESFGDPKENYELVKSDGQYVYFSQVLPAQDSTGNHNPSYGYCWK